MLNTAATTASLKAGNLVRCLLLLYWASLLFFLPLQDPGSPHASVGSPLDGQKVTLSPFFSSQSFPVSVSSLLPRLPVYIVHCHTLTLSTPTSVYFHLISDGQN